MTDADEELVRALHDEHAGALWAYVVSSPPETASAPTTSCRRRSCGPGATPSPSTPARGSTRAWLFTVARRLVIDDWRSARNRRESVHADVPDRAVVDESEQVLQQWVVAQALTRLSAEHRAVLRECYFAGRSVADAARTLGIPEGTVKSRTHYALMNLRLALQEMGVSR